MALREQLLGDDDTGSLGIVGVRVMRGSGKSTPVAALARDLEVVNRSPDAVLWVGSGEGPDLLLTLTGRISAPGDKFQPANIEVKGRTEEVVRSG